MLGRDLFVPGEVTHRTLPEPRLAAVADGLAFSITRGGRPVTALQPYLGAEGHLVAIREDDLAYLHVHPLDGAGPGRIAFDAELSAPGRYALFLQFKHGGRVHTGAFTIVEGG